MTAKMNTFEGSGEDTPASTGENARINRGSIERALRKLESNEPMKEYIGIRYLSGALDRGTFDNLRPGESLLNKVEETLQSLAKDGEPAVAREAENLLEKMSHHINPSTGRTGSSPIANCPKCSISVDWKWGYCPDCGFDLKTMMCNVCGTQIEPEWSYCPTCGENLSNT